MIRSDSLGRDEPAARPVVLHVVEAWGGGVASAIYDYAVSTPECRHILLATLRKEHDTRELSGHENLIFRGLPPGKMAAMRTIAAEFRRWQPDVVHAHSSIAGALTRLCPVVPVERTVYTPHCYAFERLDLPTGVRSAFRLVERVLAPRTATVAACSPREAELAFGLLGRTRAREAHRVVHVPNIVRPPTGLIPFDHAHSAGQRPLTVVAAGRLSPQKDPDFFRAVVASTRRVAPDITWRWLGGDPPEREAELRAEGIDVTGWIPRESLLTELARADVYLHTAAWEGAPIAALEAAALGLPVVARRIPALASLDVDLLADTPELVADLILGLREPLALSAAKRQSEELTRRHSPAHQQAALQQLYRQITARGRTSQANRPVLDKRAPEGDRAVR